MSRNQLSTHEQLIDAKHLGDVADELERARSKFGGIASLRIGV